MKFIHSEIGTASDNAKSSIHNWYKFTAGFSHKLVNELIEQYNLNIESKIYEPFAGCGTTLIQAQKKQIQAIGNEGQSFMCDIIRAKLNWNITSIAIENILLHLNQTVNEKYHLIDTNNFHSLLKTLYSEHNLKILYLLRDEIEIIANNQCKLFFKLALSQSMHKCSTNPISVPYISRSTVFSHNNDALHIFSQIAISMKKDIETLRNLQRTSHIFEHDSRLKNENIDDSVCDICITSPPYLNNLDYGEVSKVHTHFYEITNNWKDITDNVRSNLVTGSTTHYSDNEFKIEEWKNREFYQNNSRIGNELITYATQIKNKKNERKSGKSYDIMLLLYFEDMYHVLKETRRTVKQNGSLYMVIGDSAPYGIFVPTTDLLGKISQCVGFTSFNKHKVRERGTKWTSLSHRHKLILDENVLKCK